MAHKTRLLIAAVAVFASGCMNMYAKEQIRKVNGITISAVVSRSFAEGGSGRIALDGLVGYLAGKTIGESMGDQDKRRLAQAIDQGLGNEPGHAYRDSWKTGVRAYEIRVTPQDSYVRKGDHLWCKHFSEETAVTVKGEREDVEQDGIGCYDTRQDGWVIQSR